MELTILIVILIMLIVLSLIAYINYTVINMPPLTDEEFSDYLEDCLNMMPKTFEGTDLDRYRSIGLQIYGNEPTDLDKSKWSKNILGIEISSFKSLKLEGSTIDSLYVFENDNDRYFIFVGTKLLPTFFKEAISHSIVECPINNLRIVDVFSSTYKKYFPLIRDFVKQFDPLSHRNHLSGHSLGAVISHLFYHDFNFNFNFKTHYTMGCPRVFSSLTSFNSIALNFIVSGDMIPIFYDQIINGEGTIFPGNVLYLNENSSSWAINHHPVFYLYCALKFFSANNNFRNM